MKTLCLLLIVCLLSCTSVPYQFAPVQHVPSIPAQPGDEELAQVSIGEMRNALFIDEAYDALLILHNSEVEIAKQVQRELAVTQVQLFVTSGAAVLASVAALVLAFK